MVYHAMMFDMEEEHTKHVTYKIAYHFVWCPKYRKDILKGEIASFVASEIRRLCADNACVASEIRRLCADNAWEIGTLNVREDHVHLFLSAPPAISPALIANTLKGITARQVFKQHPEVKKQLWGGSFWSRSYYVRTAGDMTEETVQKYIELGQG